MSKFKVGDRVAVYGGGIFSTTPFEVIPAVEFVEVRRKGSK